MNIKMHYPYSLFSIFFLFQFPVCNFRKHVPYQNGFFVLGRSAPSPPLELTPHGFCYAFIIVCSYDKTAHFPL